MGIHVRVNTEASVPLRNEANEPPVVKNVCAVLTGKAEAEEGTCGTFLIFFKSFGFRSKEE
jgi:hypothetical protein